MTVTFNTIDENTPIKNRDNFNFRLVGVAITIPIFVLAVGILTPGKIMGIILLVLISGLIFGYGRRLLPDWIWEKDFLGKLSLSPTEITLTIGTQKESFEIEELQELTLVHSRVRGESEGKVTLNGIAQLELQFKDEKRKMIKFIIQDKEQFSKLKGIITSWYHQELSIKEYMSEWKLACLQLEPITSMSYKEIQKIKKELKLQ